jgi:hypothetical protein
MKERNYSDDLEIDINALEKEWEKQPSTFMYYSKKEAFAQEEKDRAAQKLNIIYAEMDSKVRKNPSKYGITAEKPTDTAIKQVILRSEDYKTAEENVIIKTKQMRILSAAVIAFEHKKRALTKLTDLYINNYYSSGGVPKEFKDNISKNHTNKIREGLNKRRED